MTTDNDEPSWLRETGDNTPLMGSGNPFGPPGSPPITNAHNYHNDGTGNWSLNQPAQKVTTATENNKNTNKKTSENTFWHKEDDEEASHPSSKKSPKKTFWHREEGNEKTLLITKIGEKERIKLLKSPSKHWLLVFFHAFEFLSLIPLLCLLAIQVFPIIFVPIKELGFLQTIIKVYVSIFVLALIMVELRVPIPALRENYLLQTFFTRGFFHTFVGILGLEEQYLNTKDHLVENAFAQFEMDWFPLARMITCWSVFGIGCLYMIFGTLCLQLLRNKLYEKYKKKVAEYEGAALS